MQITCRLHVVLILIFITPLPRPNHKGFREIRSTRGRYASYWNAILLYIFLLIKINVSESSASHHLFLFTFANRLLITCAFSFNIHYLFVYFFKTMSTKTHGTDHLFLFTYGNWLLITCGFHFNIHYLFVYLF